MCGKCNKKVSNTWGGNFKDRGHMGNLGTDGM